MKLFLRMTAIFIIIVFMAGMLPISNNIGDAYAASAAIKISKDNNGQFLLTASSVTLEWNNVSGALQYKLEYVDSLNISHEILIDPPFKSVVTCQILELRTDFIYNFMVTADMPEPYTDRIASKKIITGITFDIPNEVDDGRIPGAYSDLAGGGRQIGIKPSLKFRWNIPKYFNGTEVVPYDGYENIDYNITWGTDSLGTNKNQYSIRYSNISGNGGYIATTYTGSEVRSVASEVYIDTSDSQTIYFDCYGPDVVNPSVLPWYVNSNYPAKGIDPKFNNENMYDFPKNSDGSFNYSAVNLQNIYYNSDVKPGTVYKAKIEPVFNSNFDINGVGFLPTQLQGGFAYTPIRFQITKDSTGNLLVTVYKINQENRDTSSTVNFTYVVEYGTNADLFGSTTSARQTDEFSPGGTVVIYIENKNFNTPYYYKVSAWSPTKNEVLTSDAMQYTISQDSSLPPLPEDVQVVDIEANEGYVKNIFYPEIATADQLNYLVKSSVVTLRWKKPSNFSELISETDPAKQLYYHFEISSTQSESTTDEVINNIFGDKSKTTTQTGGFREVLKINLNACTEEGNYLKVKLDGIDLFTKVEKVDGVLVPAINLPDDYNGYPTYLLPNRSYYLKVYTAKDNAGDNPPTSDASIPVGFTTNLDSEKIPPSPKNFQLYKNGLPEINNHKPVVLEWDKISFNIKDYTSDLEKTAKVYYELYMSDGKYLDSSKRPDEEEYQDTKISLDGNEITFMKIGTSSESGDVVFDGYENEGSSIVDAVVGDFKTNPNVASVFGEDLKKNSTYYFIVKTIVSLSAEVPLESAFSQIVSVTTLKGDIVEPDGKEMNPRAPANLAIARDSDGNPIIDSSNVVLRWTELDKNVKYTLIRTSKPIGSEDLIEDIQGKADLICKEYLRYKGTNDSVVGMTNDEQTNEIRFSVTELDPNRIYYFSLRGERDDEDGDLSNLLVSPWVSLPVTTSIIDAPYLLDVVPGHEIGISWVESGVYSTEDFTVFLNNTHAAAGSVTISERIETPTTSRFYARFKSLKPDTSYNVQIKGSTYDGDGVLQTFVLDIPSNQIDSITNTVRNKTREQYHQLDVKWKGRDGFKFELAIKGENDVDYTVVSENTGFSYVSIEKPTDLISTSYSMYYARIPDLKSNTKYYIKVRCIESDADTLTGKIINTYSKYLGPVTARTEYNQEDFDNADKITKNHAKYMDQVKKYTESYFWIIENKESSYIIKFREEKINNYITNSLDNELVVDMTGIISQESFSRGFYLPLSTLEKLNSLNKGLLIKVSGTEFLLGPNVINTMDNLEISDVTDNDEVKGTYIYYKVEKGKSTGVTMPKNSQLVSDVMTINAITVGTELSDKKIEDEIENYVDKNIAIGLEDLDNYDGKMALDDLLEYIGLDLDTAIKYHVDGLFGGKYNVIYTKNRLTSFNIPASVKMTPSDSGKESIMGYVIYAGNMQKSASSRVDPNGLVTFTVPRPSSVALLGYSSEDMVNLPENHWASGDIKKFTAKVDISDILGNKAEDFIDTNITVASAVDIIERAFRKTGLQEKYSDIQKKAYALGLEECINFVNSSRVLTRQEMAQLIIKVYEVKTGVITSNVRSLRAINIKDENDISSNYKKTVELCTSMKFIDLDKYNNFYPKSTCSYAQFISAFARLYDYGGMGGGTL